MSSRPSTERRGTSCSVGVTSSYTLLAAAGATNASYASSIVAVQVNAYMPDFHTYGRRCAAA